MLRVKAILIGLMTLTSYRSVPGQTDSSPFYTSTGEHVSISGAAISQDRLCGACRKLHKRCKEPSYDKKIHYGDVLYIKDIGFRVVNDCMGVRKHWKVVTKKGFKSLFKKQTNWVDVWVETYKDEHKFHKQYGISKHEIWLIKEQNETH